MTRWLLAGTILITWAALAWADEADSPKSYMVHCEFIADRLKFDLSNGQSVPRRLFVVLTGETKAKLGEEFTIRAAQVGPTGQNNSPQSAVFSVTGKLSKDSKGKLKALVQGRAEVFVSAFHDGSRAEKHRVNSLLQPALDKPLTFSQSRGYSVVDWGAKFRFLTYDDEFWLLSVSDEPESIDDSPKWNRRLDAHRTQMLSERRTEYGEKLLKAIETKPGVANSEVETTLVEFLNDSEIDSGRIECAFYLAGLERERRQLLGIKPPNGWGTQSQSQSRKDPP